MNLRPLLDALEELDRYPPSTEVRPAREQSLLAIGRFLETHIRSGQPFDLKAVHPNPLWHVFEERLHNAFLRARDKAPAPGVVRMHQAYSSGVIFQSRDRVVGVDVVPLRRVYGWEDRFKMTEHLADWLDALLITHRHEDHYDSELVRACLRAGTPVYMPEPLARTWKPTPLLNAVCDGDEWEVAGLRVQARTGIHVWRDEASAMPLCVYEMVWPDGLAVVHGGDVDYTKNLEKSAGLDIHAFFLPWRAPNALYEEGHHLQKAPLHEAVRMALDRLEPDVLFFEHCAELEHVYDGFPASFDMAFDLKRSLPVASELLFWGEWMDLPVSA